MKKRVLSFLFLIIISLFSINFIKKQVVSRRLGSEWGPGLFAESSEVYRLLPLISSMQIAWIEEIAKTVVRLPDFQDIFDSLKESDFKMQLRRQYYLYTQGQSVDGVFITFSISELLGAGIITQRILEASSSGNLDFSNLKISVLKGLNEALSRVDRVVNNLNLSSNFLTYISARDLSSYLSRLQSLNLSYNNLVFLESGCFDDLQNLEFLDLGHNNLSILPNYIFSNLRSLQKLDLSDNQIKDLNRQSFFGLDKLEMLNLIDNNISNLPKARKSMKDLPSLADLKL